MERTLRQRIKTIKEIKNQHGMSIPQIQDIVADHGGYVSPRTMYDIFADGSEEKNFHYQSIAPIYEALIDVYGDDYSSDDVIALKQMLKERNRQIDDLLVQLESKQDEFDKRLAIFLHDEALRINSDTIQLTQEQIAKYIGSAREVVSRMLKYFANEGIVEVSRKGVRILDKERLRDLTL